MQVQHLAPETTPTSGFDTTDINFAFNEEIEELGLDEELPPSDPTDIDLVPSNPILTTDEAALSTGSDPSSNAETVSGTLVVAGNGVEYTIDSNQAGNNGTLTLNPITGEFTYILTIPVDYGDNPGTNTVNGVETFNYTATDDFGNTTTGTITINVIDLSLIHI